MTAADTLWLRVLRTEVRRRLDAARSSQASLAEHLGISPKHMSQVLNGTINGSPDLLARMAEAVGLRIAIVATGNPPVALAPDMRGRCRKPKG